MQEITARIKYIEWQLADRHREVAAWKAEKAKISLAPSETIYKTVGTRSQGQSFGELALINRDGKRNARITCEAETYLGVLCKADYDGCLEKIEIEHQSNLIEFIKSMPYFSTMSKGGILKIVKSLDNIKCCKGQNITKENFKKISNGSNDYVYFVQKGEFAAF